MPNGSYLQIVENSDSALSADQRYNTTIEEILPH